LTSSSKPSPFGSFGGLGKPAGGGGSIGNPVGFGFGSPPRTPDGDGNGSSGSKSGASSDAAEPKDNESQEVTPQPDSDRRDAGSLGLLGSSPHDEEGEGEEQEDTVYSVKLRVFRLKTKEEGGPGWAEMGNGMYARFRSNRVI
jgi:nucleoporin NUP2